MIYVIVPADELNVQGPILNPAEHLQLWFFPKIVNGKSLLLFLQKGSILYTG